MVDYSPKRTRTCGLSQARKRDKFGLAICNHCSNEIKEKRWSPALRQLFTEQKSLFNLTFWQRYGFWVGWLSVWPALFLATGCISHSGLVIRPHISLNIRRKALFFWLSCGIENLTETHLFTRLLRRRLLQQIPERFAAAIANPLVAFQIEMIAALFGCQPHGATAPDG